MEAWNHHPLRTEHGLSPLQLWHRGMLSASPRWQQEIADGFCVPPDYGIEESEYFVYNFHHPSVVVPRTDINLTTHQKRQLEGLYSLFSTVIMEVLIYMWMLGIIFLVSPIAKFVYSSIQMTVDVDCLASFSKFIRSCFFFNSLFVDCTDPLWG